MDRREVCGREVQVHSHGQICEICQGNVNVDSFNELYIYGCGFLQVLGNKYVTDTETISSMAHHLRLMKSCIDNYYTVFPFSKNSPLTPYVNNKVTQLTSAGIIEHWFDMMTVKYGKSYMAEFFDNRVLGSEAKPLKI